MTTQPRTLGRQPDPEPEFDPTYGFNPFVDYKVQAVFAGGVIAKDGTPIAGQLNRDYTGDTETFSFAKGEAFIEALPEDALESDVRLRCERLARLNNPAGRYIITERVMPTYRAPLATAEAEAVPRGAGGRFLSKAEREQLEASEAAAAAAASGGAAPAQDPPANL